MRLFSLKVSALLFGLVPVIYSAQTCHSIKSYAHGAKLCYFIKNKSLDIKIDKDTWEIPLEGYGVGTPKISPLPSKLNSFVFSYIDMSGFSAGGDVKLFKWQNHALSPACDNNLYANSLLPIFVDGKAYIALMQHYTDDYYYASSMLDVNENGWSQTNDSSPWNQIIKNYQESANKAKSDYAKGNYYAFIASAYIYSNNKNQASEYVKLAQRQYIHKIPFIEAMPSILKSAQKPASSGIWCKPLAAS